MASVGKTPTVPSDIGSHGEIARFVRQCLDGFGKLLRISGDEEENTIEDEASRFRMWAGNVAAHRTGRRSLEHRLRDSASLRSEVVRLLEDLIEALNEAMTLAEEFAGKPKKLISGYSADSNFSKSKDFIPGNLADPGLATDSSPCAALSEPSSAIEEESTDLSDMKICIFEEIQDIVTCLLRFSIALRRPTKHDADKYQSGQIARSHFPHDLAHVRSKFPASSDFLTERLARAISRRRQYLAYRATHHEKLIEGLETDENNHRKISNADASSSEETNMPKDLSSTAFETNSQMSETSFGSTFSTTARLCPPPRPEASKGGSPFECTLCYSIVNTEDEKDWRRHVYEDLGPYICIHESCSTADHQYDRRRDWIQHLDQVHNRVWRCPFSCQISLSSYQDFERHLTSRHASFANELSPGALAHTFSRRDNKGTTLTCPLCQESFNVADNRTFSPFGAAWPKHLGHHMEQLALFALPASLRSAKGDGAEDWKAQHDTESKFHQRDEWIFDSELGSPQFTATVDVFDHSDEDALLSKIEEKSPQIPIEKRGAESQHARLRALFEFPHSSREQWEMGSLRDKLEAESLEEPQTSSSTRLERADTPERRRSIDRDCVYDQPELHQTEQPTRDTKETQKSVRQIPAGPKMYRPQDRLTWDRPPVTESRPLTSVEAWSLYHFETHARSCESCYDPMDVYRRKRSLCHEGHALAKDVRHHVQHRNGEYYFSQESNKALVAAMIPDNYTMTRSLLRALDLGSRSSRRHTPIFSNAPNPNEYAIARQATSTDRNSSVRLRPIVSHTPTVKDYGVGSQANLTNRDGTVIVEPAKSSNLRATPGGSAGYARPADRPEEDKEHAAKAGRKIFYW